MALAYYEEKQIVAAWCTMREDFRNFRTDRIIGAAWAKPGLGVVREAAARGSRGPEREVSPRRLGEPTYADLLSPLAKMDAT